MISECAMDMAESVEGGDIDGAEKSASELITEINASESGIKASGELFSDIGLRQDVVRAKRDNPEEYSGLPIGVRDIDEIVLGMLGGNLGVVFGFSQSGKSMLLRHIGIVGWILGRNVVHVTLEDSLPIVQNSYDVLMLNRFEDIMHRYTDLTRYKFPTSREAVERELRRRKTGVPIYNDFKTGLSEPQEKLWKQRMESISGVCPHSGGINVIEMDEYSTIDEISARIEMQAHRPGLIVVDYANLISASKEASNDPYDWRAQATVMGRLHSLAKNTVGQDGRVGVPVWVASQSSKDVEKKNIDRVDISNVTGVSYLITQAPDVCLYARGCERLKIIKCRDAEVGYVARMFPDFPRKDIMDPLAEFTETGKVAMCRGY